MAPAPIAENSRWTPGVFPGPRTDTQPPSGVRRPGQTKISGCFARRLHACGKPRHCFARHGIEALAAGLLQMRGDLRPHAGIPEAQEMIENAIDGVFALRFDLEIMTDVVGHLDQTFDVHAATAPSVTGALAPSAMRAGQA